jgi:hypothetical protein
VSSSSASSSLSLSSSVSSVFSSTSSLSSSSTSSVSYVPVNAQFSTPQSNATLQSVQNTAAGAPHVTIINIRQKLRESGSYSPRGSLQGMTFFCFCDALCCCLSPVSGACGSVWTG